MKNIILRYDSLKVKNKLNQLVVIKRDGRRVPFDSFKIYSALEKAITAINSSLDLYNIEKIVDNILLEIANRFDKDIKIYEIQNIVEHILIELGEKSLVEEYISYRVNRDVQRDRSLDINFAIEKLVNRDESLVNENANKDSLVFNTHRDLTSGVVAKAIGLKMLPEHVANAHQKGDIHYHDLDYSPYQPLTNCCLIDFKEMLTKGFKIGNADVESPKSITTATAQMAQIIANVASSQYGGCSADRIDEVLAPFAKLNYEKNLKLAKEWIEDEIKQEKFAEEKTKKDIYDAMQSLEYEINTLYSSQGQTPFTSLGFGLGEDFFAREIQKAILKVRINGLGKEKRTAIFPKLIFVLKDGLNLRKEDPNYDIKQLALECATNRMYPDVVMYDTLTKITGSCKTPMGCRSFLPSWQDEDGNYVESGRMNLGVVTLNLPRIALESNVDKERFWNILEERLSICKDALVYRIKRCSEAKPENAPILYMHGAFGKRLSAGDSVNKLFKNKRATLSLGYIGLYEVASVFYGGDWEHNKEAKDFTIEIMSKLKQSVDSWTNQYDYWFSVYATPSESLTDRFNKLDRKKFGVLQDITDKEYYTNSYHYDVRKKPTPFEKIDFEKDYPYYSSGGFIHYCEYPVLKQNPKALEAVWDFAYDKIGYLGTNTPIDKCYKCNYEGDFEPTDKGFKCPNCENTDPNTCDVVKRTCGYLGNPQARPMIRGRHKEIAARVKHMK
ncbi:anaerobic ribonucleoside-triphosphate reductase [Gemelliphila palaticanis]|uniref:Anaerobic ribonucleoside-triphosphate reductase n=1 Tax=Gemelliphila palaticanis TaxID=81950 RepID=A0ABX2SX00_9BACL|nr:anaerobic ribonucleoside-triphosphate reductase [Gemella palaticanis]MBF0714713.1 anaerobic ribonucleoside-triphosphate reductase [Gemella palaticanis]NYS46643.1 anaerobic ribonucleoside-triphosphate reductase [Gemella palaticanis]